MFVLATTDPQKVSDTIRSRTQHLRFHLLAPETLAEHVRWVAADAGLDLDESAIDAAVAQGAGSARDALSALELIANAGGDAGDALSFDELVEALIEHDAGHALTAVAHAINAGHEPRALAEALVRHLRNGFLSLMAPELVQLSAHQVDALAAQAQRLGPAGSCGRSSASATILTELRHAPDPRVLVEVALVQLASAPPAASGDDIAPLAARVAALEHALAEGRVPAPAAAAPVDPATGRTQLGGRAKRAAADAERTDGPARLRRAADPRPARSGAGAGRRRAVRRAGRRSRGGVGAGQADAAGAWPAPCSHPSTSSPRRRHDHARRTERHPPRQVPRARRRRRAGAAPTQAGRPVTIELVSRDGPASPAGSAPPPSPPADDEEIDLDDLVDAPPGPSALDRLAEAFPGSELVERRDR